MPRPRFACALILACLLAPGLAGPPPKAAQEGAAVRVAGTSLTVALPDGRILTGTDLVGAVLTIADDQAKRIQVRIDGAEPDPEDAEGRRLLYRLSAQDPVTGSWHNFCRPGPKGLTLGFPVSGIIDETGAYRPSPGRFAMTCTSGAIGKCVRMGYEPCASGPDSVPLAPYFEACLRMVRADYCGDGRPHTRDGTTINIYDRLGVQVPDPAPEMTFEAAWGPDGAVCVRRTRIEGIWTLPDLLKSCPARLAGKLGEACDKAQVLTLPEALIFNDSRPGP